MTTITRFALSCIAALSLFGTTVAKADPFHSQNAHAHGSYGSVERLAVEIQGHSRELFAELRSHFVNTPCYRDLFADTSNLYRSAVRIQIMARSHGSLYSLDQEAHRLDNLVIHMQNELRHSGVDLHGIHHIQELLAHVDDLIHTLDREVIALNRPVYHSGPSFGGYAPRRSISFGNGGFSFSLSK